MTLSLTYPDGTIVEHPDGATGHDVAMSIGPRLAKAAIAVKLDGELLDLARPLPGDGRFEVVTEATDDGRHILRHSAAHVLAQAVLNLFEGATFAIGPPITDGFYYDFDIGRPFTPEDLEAIEEEMARIIELDQPFVREEMDREAGLALFARHRFKTEIIESVDGSEVEAGNIVSVYRNNGFVDLCRGPHVPSTGRLKAVKLLRSAGAYWRGDEKRPQLQRIYGTAWESKQALEEHLHRLEEAEKRDHRKLGRELGLYSFPAELGSGLAVWHPNGGMLRKVIEDYSRRIHEQYGFDFVYSPHLAKAHLWQTSGHLDFYADLMYPSMEMDESDEYRVKPMNCPFHVMIYRSDARSYRDLPLRFGELGTVYRYEMSGVVHGLMRARGFTQDDSHTFATREQMPDELAMHLDFVLSLLRDFGFEEFEADLSTRPEDKWVGELDLWEQATQALRDALDASNIPYRIAEGEGAFYGPKIDVHIKDAIGRRWQMSTIQVDFNLPERFELEYITAGDDRERPVMIHSAKFGSVERFIGILVEHYAGAFPVWFSPVQAVVVPVADRHEGYAGEVASALRAAGLRVDVDTGTGKLGEKIRTAHLRRIPAIAVVGDNDVENRSVGLTVRGSDERRGTALSDAVAELEKLAAPPR